MQKLQMLYNISCSHEHYKPGMARTYILIINTVLHIPQPGVLRYGELQIRKFSPCSLDEYITLKPLGVVELSTWKIKPNYEIYKYKYSTDPARNCAQ